MKLHQLKYAFTVAKQGLNVSLAAEQLHTSQPGVSKQIRLLEEEIGVSIFNRTGKRLTDITPAGNEIVHRISTILREIENIKQIGKEHTGEEEGTLVIATTHTQARYVLPKIVKTFLSQHPNVNLSVKQGYPKQISQMVLDGEADLVIATEAVSQARSLMALPCYKWNRCVLVLPKHPLLKRRIRLTLKDLSKYPIVTYDDAFAGQTHVHQAFADAGLQANVVFTALDTDVIKAYVEIGLGIGLVATMAYKKSHDKSLRMIDVGHLFEPNTTWVGIRRGSYLRRYVYEFIQLFAPHLDKKTVMAAMQLD